MSLGIDKGKYCNSYNARGVTVKYHGQQKKLFACPICHLDEL